MRAVRRYAKQLGTGYLALDDVVVDKPFCRRISLVGWTWIGLLHTRTTVCYHKRRWTGASSGDWLPLKWRARLQRLRLHPKEILGEVKDRLQGEVMTGGLPAPEPLKGKVALELLLPRKSCN
jgi:hypothetical protein